MERNFKENKRNQEKDLTTFSFFIQKFFKILKKD
jgi:hypothetical protein